MVAISLKQTVEAGWAGIAEMVTQLLTTLPVKRENALSPAAAIVQASELIDSLDGGLARIAALREELEAVWLQVASLDPPVSVERTPQLFEIRRELDSQEKLISVCRVRRLNYMRQVNPEDAWAWEPEILAMIQRAKAGRVSAISPG
jgi:hypothetical protein